MACTECHKFKLRKYKHYSKKTELAHLIHIGECIHYANRYLIRLLSNKCRIRKQTRRIMLAVMLHHRGIHKYYINQNQALLSRLLSLLEYHVGDNLLYLILSSLREKHLKWISKNQRIMNHLHESKDYILDEMKPVHSVMAFVGPIYKVASRFEKYGIYLKLTNNEKYHTMARILYHTLSEEYGKLEWSYDDILSKYLKMDMHVDCKCGNHRCKHVYLKDNYGISERIDWCSSVPSEEKLRTIMENNDKKWKLCKGCKTTYYCSRKCQKISWKQGHKQQCQKLQKLIVSISNF